MTTSTSSHPAIEFKHVSFQVNGSRELLHDVSFTVDPGETLVLLGRSGSGKTTSLKLINRLLEPSAGDILVDGRSVRDWDVVRLRRSLGYVIQEIGLFPHYSVERNITLVPRIEKWPQDRVRARLQELLTLVGLDRSIAPRHPNELSGGQRQRVGVARALAGDPPFLLMDEPFGALDPVTRAELQREFLQLQKHLRKTVVFVTHDLREALLLASRIALIEGGRLVSMHSPKDFLQSKEPLAAAYVAAFATDIASLADRGTS
jgi:osmoprotectant transport system ATP-binding protein